MWEDVKMRRWGEDGRMRRCEDEKMWRWEDVKMWRWEDVKMRRCEDEKMRRRWEDVKMRRCEDEKMWRWEDVKMRGCEDEKMRRWEDVKMTRCEDEKMWRWEDVKMRGCEDEKMWRWEDVKMWRWEDVKMRRCFTDPHYWKEPCAQTLSGKNQWFLFFWYLSMDVETSNTTVWQKDTKGPMVLLSDIYCLCYFIVSLCHFHGFAIFGLGSWSNAPHLFGAKPCFHSSNWLGRQEGSASRGMQKITFQSHRAPPGKMGDS